MPSSLYLTMLVIIYWALDLSQGHLQGDGSWGVPRPVLGLFKCPWLNLRASLTGRCRVRTGGLGVSMRVMEPEEGGVVAVSRTPGPGFSGIFAAGASPSDAAFPSQSGGEGAEGGGKGGYRGT
jgi:hypothetical protein